MVIHIVFSLDVCIMHINSMSKISKTANLLGAVAGLVNNRLEEELKIHPNANSTASAALNVIDMFEVCSITQLARGLCLSHSAVVRLAEKMELSGWVRRQAGDDKRTVNLELTDSGKAHLRNVLDTRLTTLKPIVSRLSTTQQRQLEKILSVMIEDSVNSEMDAVSVCRLCDGQVCPEHDCPAHHKLSSLDS